MYTKLFREEKFYCLAFFIQTNLDKHVGRIQTSHGQNLKTI